MDFPAFSINSVSELWDHFYQYFILVSVFLLYLIWEPVKYVFKEIKVGWDKASEAHKTIGDEKPKHNFKKGDLVQVKGMRGPEMMIIREDKGDKNSLHCFWFDSNNTLQFNQFSHEFIEKVDPNAIPF